MSKNITQYNATKLNNIKKSNLKVIKFKGGLGNQLFQYSLYKFFEKKDCKVYADLSFYKNQKKFKKIAKRKFYLNHILKEKINVLDVKNKFIQYSFIQRFEKFFTILLKLGFNLPVVYWEGYWQQFFFAKHIKKKNV